MCASHRGLTDLGMKNPVCTILWEDAAYSFENEVPTEGPKPQLTAGFIMETNDTFTFIATNVRYSKEDGSLYPVDGFIIPENAILEFKKTGDCNERA